MMSQHILAGLVWLISIGPLAAPAAAAMNSSTARYLDSSDGRNWPGYGRTFGEQHVAVLTGLGTSSALFVAANPEIGKYGLHRLAQTRRVLAFALSGKSTLPASEPVLPAPLEDPEFRPDPSGAEAGRALYEPHCSQCHGSSLIALLQSPDLRRSAIPQLGNLRQYIVRRRTSCATHSTRASRTERYDITNEG